MSENPRHLVEEFARVMANAQDGVGLYDPDGRAIYVNKVAEAFLGEDHRVDPFVVVHADDRDRVRQLFRDVVRNAAPDRFQARLFARDRTLHLMDLEVSPVTDASGGVIAVLSLGRDVTRELREKAALQGVLRTLFDQVPLGIAITQPDGRFAKTNARMRDMLGYEVPELFNMRMGDLVHPDDKTRMRALQDDLVAGRIGRFVAEKRMLRPSGEVWWASCVAAMVHPPFGGDSFVVLIMDDITAQKKVSGELRERNELLSRIFEYAPIGIAITDENARYVGANRRFLEMLGYTQEELFKLTGWDVVHPDDREASRKLRDELFSGVRDDFTWDRRYKRKDGSTLWVQNTVAVMRGVDNSSKYAIALIEDATPRRLSEAAIHATSDRLHALSRRLVEMQELERRDIARELHDRVGQTLTAMRINMDMIRTRLEKHDDAEIRKRNDDSIQLIESTFKAVENVMYELRPPMLEEYGVVAALQWYARQFIERTGIKVEVRGHEGSRCGPEAELAAYRIAQEALTNVARHSKAKRVVIDVTWRPDAGILAIEDDGIGFDAGPREDEGYGMITMRERAEAVGGTLEIESHKGQGTRIVVTMPRKQ